MPVHDAEIPRQIRARSAANLAGLRVLVLNGPRQAGKTTLLNRLIAVDGGELRRVKAGLTVRESDFRHLAVLKAKLGSDFVHGFVVYLGQQVLSFGDGLTAVPLGALWARYPDAA